MTFIVNGEERAAEARTLSELLSALGYEGNWLATAVNGELVHRQDREHFEINGGDRIEVLAPMKGG